MTIRVALVAGLLALALAACGSDDEPAPATETETVTVTAEPTEAPSSPATVTAEPTADPIQFRLVVGSSLGSPPPDDCSFPGDPELEPPGRLDQCDVYSFDCGAPPVPTAANQPMMACDAADPPLAYALTSAVIEGGVVAADYGIPQGQTQYAVTLELGGPSRDTFNQLSVDLARDVDQFAIVLDGVVLSAPTFQGAITGGMAQITGNFTEDEARELAEGIKAGG